MTEPVPIAPGVWRLSLPMQTPPGHINSWLLKDGDGWLVVDCGTRTEETRNIWKAFMTSPLHGGGIRQILLTHAHPDHAGCAPWLARETGAPVLMAPEEKRALENFAVDDEQRDAEIGAWMSRYGASRTQVEMTQLFYRHFARGCVQIHSRIELVEPGDGIEVDGTRWELHGGYGHTPCNLLVHQPERGLLITGDQILPDIVTHVGLWWRQEENPLPLYLESLSRLRGLPVHLALPAHGDPFDTFAARCDQLADAQEQRLDRIRRALEQGESTLEELLAKFGGPALSGPAFPLIAGQIHARLSCLVTRGTVVGTGNPPGYRLRHTPAEVAAGK